MKKVILLLLLLPYLAAGQIIDSFESGLSDQWEQSSPGRWSADSAWALSGRYSLHHTFDNTEAGADRIALPVLNLHPGEGVTKWSFTVRHGYDPSSSNNWAVFLFSDKGPSDMAPDGGTRGYAIGVNLAGYDDTLRLWKINGDILSVVVNCHVNWQTDVGTTTPVRAEVERSKDGVWKVNLSKSDGSNIGISYGNDNELFDSFWFGIFYRYSSTRDRLLWVDDIKISGVFYEDTTSPFVTGYSVCGRKSIRVLFSEEPAAPLPGIENFFLNPERKNPVSVTAEDKLTWLLEFPDDFINKTLNDITVSKICDNAGNCSSDTIIEFVPVWAETGDVIISEIMADPVPAVSLPEKEYIEVMNRTTFSLNTAGWKIIADNQEISFPCTNIESGEILILCNIADTSVFSAYGKSVGVKQFPVLNDGGKLLCLVDSSGLLIHGVQYSGEWYGSGLKSGGGWSLEMIDTDFPFHYEANWAASKARKGGTPGLPNSISGINNDDSFQGIINAYPSDNMNIIIKFSEPVPDFGIISKSTIEDGPGLADIIPADRLYREFIIKIKAELVVGKIYTISLPAGIKDFAGNKPVRSSFSFGLTENASEGDFKFNELLFNPLPGDPDYIEFHNCSDKILDASRLYLTSLNSSTSDTSALNPVSLSKKCILPGTYYVITDSRSRIIERYPSSVPENIFEISSMPSMPDKNGILILLNSELDVIDKVTYNENMHYSILSGYEGIALEKTGRCSRSDESLNWHSAAESSGWGTPGSPNSVSADTMSEAEMINFSSTKITPDNDGFEDFLIITYAPGGSGNVVSISVFDETGSFVKKIASNMLTGAEATFIWDGTADDGTPVISGIYIVFITWYDDKGNTGRIKQVCSVLR